jgi:hypothetical protein
MNTYMVVNSTGKCVAVSHDRQTAYARCAMFARGSGHNVVESITIPTADWLRLVALVRAQTLASENNGWLTREAQDELDKLIASVNGGE